MRINELQPGECIMTRRGFTPDPDALYLCDGRCLCGHHFGKCRHYRARYQRPAQIYRLKPEDGVGFECETCRADVRRLIGAAHA